MIWIVILMIFGVAFIVAEVFFPSMGILSIIAAVAWGAAVLLGFQDGMGTGIAVLAAAALLVPLSVYQALKILPRTGLGKALVLEPDDAGGAGGGAQEEGLEALAGRTGVTLSPLRPAGFARIEGQRVDVVTRGDLIDTGVAIRVLEVEGNRVVVAEHKEPAES